MRRRGFFAALFGGAAVGQDVPIRLADTMEQRAAYHMSGYRNGECPVCGTMAEPWHCTTGTCRLGKSYSDGGVECIPDPCPPDSAREIECAHCHVKFVQRSEAPNA